MYLQNLALLKIIQKIFVFISYLTDWYSLTHSEMVTIQLRLEQVLTLYARISV